MAALTIKKRIDRSSTALMRILKNNEAVGKAVLTVRKAGGGPLKYLEIVLTDPKVSSIELTASEGGLGSSPTVFESVALSFRKVNVKYTPQTTIGGGGGATEFEADARIPQ